MTSEAMTESIGNCPECHRICTETDPRPIRPQVSQRGLRSMRLRRQSIFVKR